MAVKNILGLAAGVVVCAAGAALAQSYPVKRIRVIIPQPPGAGIDIIVRRASDDILQKLGQPLVVENRAGGAMVIAADRWRHERQ